MKYKTILADPPWTFTVWSDKGKDRSPDKHYDTMTLEDIKNLPIKQVAADVSCLYLWVPDGHIEQGIEVMNNWGFHYKSFAFVWYKVKKDLKQAFLKEFGTLDLTNIDFDTIDIDKLFFRIGLGYHTRKQVEVCLYGTTLTPPSRKDKGIRQVIGAEEIFDPIGQHSAKPEKQYNRIEALSEGPYLELFARKQRNGWEMVGDEIDGKDIRDALKEIQK